MKFPSFHLPQGAKEWLMALLWASISGGINSVIEYYATGIEVDFFTESGRQILFSRFAFGFVGGLVMYLKVFVRGASKQTETDKANAQTFDGGEFPTKKE
jgi:hypothetical protein